MRRGRVLLLVILIYVGLDLCLPDMPGAFMFGPAGSVESVEAASGRMISDVVVLPAPASEAFLAPKAPQTDLRHRLPARIEFPLPWRTQLNRVPWATAASPSSSEDPH
jgi:hypothetical protein